MTAITAFVALRPLLPQGGDGVPWGAAAIVAAYTVAAHSGERVAWLGLGASLATGLLVMAHDGTSWNLGGFLFFGFYFTAPWLVQERVEEAQRAVWESASGLLASFTTSSVTPWA